MFIQPLQEQHTKIYTLINETDALVKNNSFATRWPSDYREPAEMSH